MKHFTRHRSIGAMTVAALAAGVIVLAQQAAVDAKSPAPAKLPALAEQEAATCGDYGTTVTFLDSPADAAKQARKLEKLVFVLHVSGNFEVSNFT